MDSIDDFLRFYTDRMTADRPIPIDLESLAKDIDAVIEEREMIPEAVMTTLNGRFHIYVQSNFSSSPPPRRRRFSLAHEVGHTLFFERRDGDLKTRRDAPRGEALEAACHKAASMILVPTKALTGELQQRRLEDAFRIRELADRFDVSIEVMMRRLNDLSLFSTHWVPVLTRGIDQGLAVEFAVTPVWLKQYLPIPSRGMDFASWFRATEEVDGVLRRRFGSTTLEARRADIGGALVIFELRERSSS